LETPINDEYEKAILFDVPGTFKVVNEICYCNRGNFECRILGCANQDPYLESFERTAFVSERYASAATIIHEWGHTQGIFAHQDSQSYLLEFPMSSKACVDRRRVM
jgi:hypothetical protein